MNRIKRIVSVALVFVFASAVNVLAVSEDEISKMKEANPSKPIVEPAKPRKMLMVDLSAGYKHSSIPYWAKTIDIMAEKTGAFSVDHSMDLADLNKENLKKYDVVCFNNTTSLEPDESQREALMDFVTSGKGIVGIHAATDNFDNWEEGKHMMGGVFTGHPWTGGGTWAIKITEPDHPLTKPFAGNGFKLNDEIYRTDAPYYDRNKQRVLISLDLSDPATKNANGVKPSDSDTGISWIKKVGKGRLFYCSLGHQHHVTWNKPILGYYLGGIQYAMGDLKVDDSIVPFITEGLSEKVDSILDEVKQYDWDKDQAPIHKMTLLVRDCLNNPADAKIVEEKLLAILDSDVNMAVRDAICRQLAVIGTDVSINKLSQMLSVAETSNIARYAMERIVSPSVVDVFISTLEKTDDNNIKAGIINSLGVLSAEKSVPVIKKYLSDGSEIVSTTAMHALGDIGTEAALEALLESTPTVSMDRYYDSLLSGAQKLKGSNSGMAVAIYKKLYDSSKNNIVKMAAFSGLLKSDKANSSAMIKSAIEGNDQLLQQAAIKALSKMDDVSLLSSIADSIGNFSDKAKVFILAALSENANKVGESQALSLVSSKSKDVRFAVYEALAKIGTVKSLNKLAQVAAESRDRDEKEEIRKALSSMPGKDIDGFMLGAILALDKTGKEMESVEMINAAVARQVKGVSSALLKAARSSSRRVSATAIRALMTTAKAEDVKDMIDLLAEIPSTATQNAVNVLTGKLDDKSELIKTIVAKYGKLGSVNAKEAFLKVMGKIGSSEIAGILKSEYASSNEKLKEAAFRAMTEWPGTEFISLMKELAQNGKDEKTKILAMRGYLKMIQENGSDAKLALEAFDMAERKEEKRMVIGAMGDFASKAVFEFLNKMIDGSEYKAEAEISAANMAKKLATRCPEYVKANIDKFVAKLSSDSVKKIAKDAVKLADKTGAYIVDWKISKAYSEAGMSNNELFNRAFAPERNEGSWSVAKFGGNNVIDMSQTSPGESLVAYVKTNIISEIDQEVTLSMGSDDGIKVWLNGEIVHSNNAARGLTRGSDKVKVQLKKGVNTLFVKVTQNTGGWEFCLEILGENGQRANKIEVDI